MRPTREEGKRVPDDEKFVGSHGFRFYAPDRITIVFGGVFTVEEAEEVVRLMHDAGDRFGPICIGVDATEFRPSGTRVRNVFASGNGRPFNARAAAIWGTNYTIRTMFNMVIRAGTFLKKDFITYPVEFCRDEAEAWAWFATLKE